MSKRKLCDHAPDDINVGRKYLGSVVDSSLFTECGWLIAGVRFDAWDCDCASMNYGTEVTITVSAGEYGNRNVRELSGGWTSETQFRSGDEILTLRNTEPGDKAKLLEILSDVWTHAGTQSDNEEELDADMIQAQMLAARNLAEKMEERVSTCDDCGTTPQRIIEWQGKNRCPACDEKRRRKEIEDAGSIIDDEGVACQGCGFGIRLADLCVVDPDGEGPYHRECALGNGFAPSLIRLAPDEFAIFDQEDFREEARTRKN